MPNSRGIGNWLIVPPRHGDRPLSIVHIDHTQLDVELRSSSTGRLLGRPWLTLLIDAYSRRILAVYLTFDAPSYRACMMALRICVQRFGRFPVAVVVDGGKEFHSLYFDTLLARYHCIKKTRPGAKPRFGSVIERLFGTTNTQFIYNLLGNTQASKQPRSLTKAIDPKGQAVWTLGDLYAYLVEWAYQVYDLSEHPALGTTPRRAYESGLIQTGEREHRCIPYDEEFILATYPSTRTGVALIQPGRGIKLNYLYYWSDAFRNPEVERTKVPVRYDPFDIGVAYAYCQGRWVKCISQYYSTFSGHSEKELLLATIELKRLGKLTRTSTSISAKRLADFISQVQEHEALLLQRLRDLEGHQVLNALTEKPELRLALEEALARREVRAVILDEAQHLMKVGSGRGAGKLLDQLDWIKSMTNVTGVLHILIGTYELLNFQNLSGQASRRGLEVHFPRYLFQHEQDRLDFQGVLLALLKQVPLDTDIETLMQQWFYFYERSIGCVGVLKDWLIRTVAATLHDGGDTLSLEKLSEHALQVGQCERMAIDAIEGEQKLGYMASRREQLWSLLQMETVKSSLSSPEIAPTSDETASETETSAEGATAKRAKTTRKKRSSSVKSQASTSDETSSETETPASKTTAKRAKTTRKSRSSSAKSQVPTLEVETNQEPAPPKRQTTKKRQTRKKTPDTADKVPDKKKEASSSADEGIVNESEMEPASVESTPPKKKRRVGQRKPKRDPVGP